MDALLQACAQGSAMALVVLVARAFLARRLLRRAFPALWALVLARLLLPVKLPSPFSAMDFFASLTTRADEYPKLAETSGAPSIPGIMANASDMLTTSGVPWDVIWVAGTAVCLLVLTALHLAQARLMSDSRPLPRCEQTDGWLLAHPTRRPLRLLESASVRSPVARGFFRPSIVMPAGMVEGGWPGTRSALEHEFAHVRRFDPAFKFLFQFTLCLYWFDPIVWIACRTAFRDIELACDESALTRLGDDARRGYAEALLDAAAMATQPLTGRACFGQSPLAERVSAIVRPSSVPVPVGVVVTLLIAALSTGASCLFGAPLPVRVELGACSFELPAYWDGRVEVLSSDGRVAVSLAGHPEVFLVELVSDPAGQQKRSWMANDGYEMLWSGTGSDDVRYELWGLYYAGMPLRNSWHDAPASNPPYPGIEAEREAVDLSTGGATTVDEVRESSELDPEWTRYYREAIVPTVSLA